MIKIGKDQNKNDLNIDNLITALEAKREQVNNDIDKVVSSLKGLSKTLLNIGQTLSTTTASESPTHHPGKPLVISSDTFFGKNFLDACVMYLDSFLSPMGARH